jgi:hypothetical protein
MLADVLVEDLAHDGSTLRRDLPAILKELVDDAVLLDDGNEYNLQTKESAEWDDQFRTQLSKIRQDVATVAHDRKSRLRGVVDEALKPLRLQQGDTRTPRDIQLHFGADEPQVNAQAIPVWVRDGWETDEKQFLGKARAAGPDSPMLFVFLPRHKDETLQENLIRQKAAKSVLELKGTPTTAAGEEARNAMETRRKDAETTIGQILGDVIGSSKVFKGGGAELHALELIDKVQDGAKAALSRLFPRFDDGDQRGWDTAANRARQGDDSPLQAVDWKSPTEDHPVCREILAHIGAGKEGRHILAHFQQPPFGWNKDTVHGALVCLCAAGRLKAIETSSGQATATRQLDHHRIAKATFRTETVSLTAKDKIALRGLFQTVGIESKPDDDLAQRSAEYIQRLLELARNAGGEPPMPPPPNTAHLEDIRRLPGNEPLAKLLEQQSTLRQQAGEWKQLGELADKRLPSWRKLQDLLAAGGNLESLNPVRQSAESVQRDRRLLDPTDHVEPLIRQAADALREAVHSARQTYTETRNREWARLQQADAWQSLTDEQCAQLLNEKPLPEADDAPIATDEELLDAIRRTSIAQWQDRTDALSGRVDALLAAAAKLLEPKAQHISLPSATIRTSSDLDQWLDDTRARIEAKLKEGPVIL